MKKTIFFIILYVMVTFDLSALTLCSSDDSRTELNKFKATFNSWEQYLEDEANLLSKDIYDKIGRSSYLNNGFRILTATQANADSVYIIDKDGKSDSTISKSDSANLKAMVRTKSNIRVTGYGTKSNPYKFVSTGDINILKISIDGNEANSLPSEGNYTMNSCNDILSWDNNNHQITVLSDAFPMQCDNLIFRSK